MTPKLMISWWTCGPDSAFTSGIACLPLNLAQVRTRRNMAKTWRVDVDRSGIGARPRILAQNNNNNNNNNNSKSNNNNNNNNNKNSNNNNNNNKSNNNNNKKKQQQQKQKQKHE